MINRNVLLHGLSLRKSGCVALPATYYSTDVKSAIGNFKVNKIQDTSLSALKRGTGGRSSFNGIVCTVFGATGDLGMHVVNRLGKIGTQIIIPYRCDFYDAQALKVTGDLGQVLFHYYSLNDDDAIRRAVKYSNVVINLVGREWETRNFPFDKVHVEGARRIARISKEMGVQRLIHVSALNASPYPTPLLLKEGSKFLKSKFFGELAVLEEFPEATIFRPAWMWGEEDRFLRYYAYRGRLMPYTLYLWKAGEETIKQPVALADAASGIIEAVKDPNSAGKIYQAVGPRRYYLSDLCDYIYGVLRRDSTWGYKRKDIRKNPFFKLYVDFTNWAYLVDSKNCITWDKIEREGITDGLSQGAYTLEDLGVKLTNLEDVIESHIFWLRAHSYYYDEIGEFPDPPPPRIVTDA